MRRLFAATSENRAPAHTLGLLLFVLILLPLAVLFFSSSPGELLAGARHPLFAPALWLSARTSRSRPFAAFAISVARPRAFAMRFPFAREPWESSSDSLSVRLRKRR